MQVLLTSEQIQDSIARLAGEIRRKEAGRPLTVIAVMTGSIIFLADLVRKLDLPMRVWLPQSESRWSVNAAESPATASAPT